MNEHSYIRAIHDRLRSTGVHVWKINARFANGVPDAWYSGPGSDLWVEYKWRAGTPVQPFKLALSRNQEIWLRRRHAEGRRVAVILGCPDGGAVFEHRTWEGRTCPPDHWLTHNEVVAWIAAQCS